MPNKRDISAALTRLSEGKTKPADLELLRAALVQKIITVQEGIAIGGDVRNSMIVMGDYHMELSAEALRVLLQKTPSPTLPGNLAPGSYLPFPRNGFFTGRIEDLKKLEDALLSDGQSGVVVNQTITGMGGIGKTQLAVEFAYKYGHRFQGVHWLDLRQPDVLDSQIALCGGKMGLSLWPPTQPEQVTATLLEWERNHPRLLILDNFEELEAANDVLARLRHSGLRVLITSRRTDWSAALGLKRLPLEEFSPEESRDFLRKYIPADR